MSPNPQSFIEHLREKKYHPRSDKHSNALAEAIVVELLRRCSLIAQRASGGQLVYDLNFDLRFRTSTWNVDLVLGTTAGDPTSPEPGQSIRKESPARVQIAIEIKSIMTEHRKAVKNRKRDLEAHHEHVHNYNPSTIAGGFFVVNGSTSFSSPLRTEPVVHSNPSRLVEHCINELREVATSGGGSAAGLDVKCALVVDMDNLSERAEFVTRPPAPQVGDPLHFDSFIQSICELYRERFGA